MHEDQDCWHLRFIYCVNSYHNLATDTDLTEKGKKKKILAQLYKQLKEACTPWNNIWRWYLICYAVSSSQNQLWMFHKFTTTVNWLFMAINTNDQCQCLLWCMKQVTHIIDPENFAFKINFVVETNHENLTREKKLCGDIVWWQSINKRARTRQSTPSTCYLCLHCLLVARNTPSIPLACPLPLGSVLCPPPLRHPPTLYWHSMRVPRRYLWLVYHTMVLE